MLEELELVVMPVGGETMGAGVIQLTATGPDMAGNPVSEWDGVRVVKFSSVIVLGYW